MTIELWYHSGLAAEAAKDIWLFVGAMIGVMALGLRGA